MDMTQLALSIDLRAILIPYNTLNLLGTEDKIMQCLHGCRNFLQPGGRLLVQLFVPKQRIYPTTKDFPVSDVQSP